MSIAREIKDSVTMWDALDILEIDYDQGHGETFIHAWDREENTPSVHVEDTVWYDFGSGEGGDVISFVRSFTGCNFGQAIAILTRVAGANQVAGRSAPPPKKPKEPIELAERVERESRPLEPGWLCEKLIEKHGLPRDLARKWGLREGPGEALWIPHWRPPRTTDVYDAAFYALSCHMVKVRDYRADIRKNILGSQATGFYVNVRQWQELCRWDWSNKWWVTANSLVITEGESDAWAALELWPDRVICGLPSGAGKWEKGWLPVGYDTAYICLDNDAAGEEAAERMAASIPSPKIIHPPESYKDINAAWQDGAWAGDFE